MKLARVQEMQLGYLKAMNQKSTTARAAILVLNQLRGLVMHLLSSLAQTHRYHLVEQP